MTISARKRAIYVNLFFCSRLSVELFDVFEELCSSEGLGMVTQLLKYLWRQNTGYAAENFYYYDALAVVGVDEGVIKGSVSFCQIAT